MTTYRAGCWPRYRAGLGLFLRRFMRNAARLWSVLVLLSCCTPFALPEAAPATGSPNPADGTSDARKAIDAAYAKQSAAIVAGNVAAYASTFTPDFVAIDRAGHKENLQKKKQ